MEGKLPGLSVKLVRIDERSVDVKNDKEFHHFPVLLLEALKSFDSGEPFSRNHIDKITIVATAKNSLCQF